MLTGLIGVVLPVAPLCRKRRLRWYQYRLRTLLVTLTLASVGMSWFTASRQWAEHRRRAMCLNNVAEMGVTCWPWLDEKGRTNVVKQAKHACELSGWKNPAFLATLAAAQALNGDFDAARQLQAEAIDLENDATRKLAYSAAPDALRSARTLSRGEIRLVVRAAVSAKGRRGLAAIADSNRRLVVQAVSGR